MFNPVTKPGTTVSLGWNEFINEIEKQHTLFTLQKKEELNIWFRNKQESHQLLELKIKTITNSIDDEIYKLYKLNNKDIQVILKNLQQNIH